MTNFFKQHVYKPMLERGYSRVSALFLIFAVSAFFHELIVSVAFYTVQFWAFLGMLAQVSARAGRPPCAEPRARRWRPFCSRSR